MYSQRLTLRAHCPMDLSDFPMDRQKCPLELGSFAYLTEDVNYRWDPMGSNASGVSIASDMKLSQFDLIKTPTDNSIVNLNKGNISEMSWNSFPNHVIIGNKIFTTYFFPFLFCQVCIQQYH